MLVYQITVDYIVCTYRYEDLTIMSQTITSQNKNNKQKRKETKTMMLKRNYCQRGEMRLPEGCRL